MKQLFNQGGQGSTGIMSNKQAIARRFGVKQSEVVYFSSGQTLTGFKVIYDKPSQRAYALPSNLGSVTAVTLVDGLLTHSEGTVDLGALAVLREEFVTLVENFTSGFTIRVKNELVSDGQSLYRWDGALPKTVNAGGSVSADGVGKGKWVETSTSNLSYFPKPITWAGFAGGAAWDGVTNDSIPYQAAAQSGRKFLMPYGVGNIPDYSVGLYSPNFSVLGEAEQLGSLQNPVDDFRPSRTDTKYSKYHETDPASNRWDSCSIHTIVKCPQGDANPKGNAAAVTGYVRAISSEGGDHVGVHGRAEGDTSYDFGTGMGLWGGWLSAVYRPNTGSAGKLIKSIIGCEIDVQNDGPHAQNPNPAGVGELRGLAVGNTGTGHLNQGVDVFSSNSGARGRWWMGVHVRANSIVGRHLVSSEEEVGNAMVIAGAASSGTRYGGLKFSKYPYTAVGQGGHLSYGIDFREATIRLQNAIVMGPQHRITWDPDTAKGVAVETEGGDVITFRGYNIAINNSKVLGARQTGIFNMSGIADGTSYNTETVTLVNLARYLKKVTDALIFHGLIGPT